MAPDLRSRLLALTLASMFVLAACGQPKGTTSGGAGGAGEDTTELDDTGEIPQLEGGPGEVGSVGGAAEGFGEEAVDTAEATPEGLHIATVPIAPTTPELVDAINFTGFKSGGPNALLEFPIYGLNERQSLYYLIVPVINEGDEEVRNLEGRAEFYDDQGRLIWEETVFLAHLPTRLQLNPPSLPNEAEAQPELSEEASGYPLYYFPTNMGLFTFAVHDPAVAVKVKSWSLTFLVSQT
jgi:hypothetical protein